MGAMTKLTLTLVLPAMMCHAAPAFGDPPVLERVKKIQLSGRPEKKLDHLALDAKGNRLFVANMANRTLDVIDVKEGKLIKSIPDQKGIQGVTFAPELNRVFVGL